MPEIATEDNTSSQAGQKSAPRSPALKVKRLSALSPRLDAGAVSRIDFHHAFRVVFGKTCNGGEKSPVNVVYGNVI